MHIQNNQFVILPLKEGVQDSLTVTAHCKIGDDGQDFQFTILFDIKSGITSKKPASLDPVLGGVVVAGKDQVISIFEDLGGGISAQIPILFFRIFSKDIETRDFRLILKSGIKASGNLRLTAKYRKNQNRSGYYDIYIFSYFYYAFRLI